MLDKTDIPFSEAEYVMGKPAIHSGMTSGDDGIVPEFIKYAGLDDISLHFIKDAYETGQILDRWKTVVIGTVP